MLISIKNSKRSLTITQNCSQVTDSSWDSTDWYQQEAGPSKCISATLIHKDRSMPYMLKYFSQRLRQQRGFSP